MSEKEQKIADILIAISAFIPRPEKPEIGNLLEAEPLQIPIMKSGTLPAGTISNLRKLLESLAVCCKDHVFAPLPEKKPDLILNPDAGIKGLPEVNLYVPGPNGKIVEVKQPLISAEGIEIE